MTDTSYPSLRPPPPNVGSWLEEAAGRFTNPARARGAFGKTRVVRWPMASNVRQTSLSRYSSELAHPEGPFVGF